MAKDKGKRKCFWSLIINNVEATDDLIMQRYVKPKLNHCFGGYRCNFTFHQISSFTRKQAG